MILLTSEPEARELSIEILLIAILLVLMILEVILFILLKFQNFSGDLALGDHFLGVALVESIGKRSIFGIGSSTNR